MAQHNIAAPTYPASGSTNWKPTLETILESFRTAINDTDAISDPRPGKLNDRGAWSANTAYAIGDSVTNQGTRYVATVAFTSGSTFNSANWLALGVTSASASGVPTQGSRLMAGQAYSSSIDTGLPSNGNPSLNQLLLRRWVCGAAKPTGTLVVASWFQNAAVASSFFRPVIYKINPADLSLTLVADFGQVDTSAGTAAIKSTTSVATIADIAVGDFLAVGGVGQGASPTIQLSTAPDGWLPAGVAGPATGARSQGLSLDGVSGAAPASVPALGASGGITIKQTGSASIPIVYLTFAA